MTRNPLPHVAERIFGVPLVISQAKLDAILTAIGPRLTGEALELGDAEPAPRRSYAVDGDGIATIPIHGTLVQRGSWLGAMSGLTSYASIGRTLSAAMADGGVSGVLLDIDSGGGEVAGVAELAEQIATARSVKPIWAVANEAAYSAAYWLGSAARKVWLPATAGVGSIGVLAVHLDRSAQDKQDGLRYTAIYSGARKNDFDPHSQLSDPARDVLQAEVERVHGIFAAAVARHRGISASAVMATEAGLFFGDAAVSASLADRIGTLDEARAAMARQLTEARARPAAPGTRRAAMEKVNMTETGGPAPETGAGTDGPGQTAQVVDLDQARSQAKGEGAAETLAYVNEVNDLCVLAGYPAMAAELIRGKKTLAECRAALRAAQLAANAGAAGISGGHGGGQHGLAAAGPASDNYGWDRVFRAAAPDRFAARGRG